MTTKENKENRGWIVVGYEEISITKPMTIEEAREKCRKLNEDVPGYMYVVLERKTKK